MAIRQLHFLVPGDPATATGGYEYDRQMLAGLQRQGWQVRLHALHGDFPHPSAQALMQADRTLADVPDDAWVLIDGLALGAMPEVAQLHAQRLRLMALVHHPLADETGLAAAQSQQMFQAERRALQAVRLVITTGASMADALRAYVDDEQRIGVAPPGVRRPAALPTRQADGPVRLICVATITPRKGHAVLVDALAGLQDLPWTLECVGDVSRSPAAFQSLQQRIQDARLHSRIVFTGVLDDEALQARQRQADVFVLATHFEGYGMAVADALAHGLPVVATRTGEIGSLVGADAGLLVNSGDASALREALSTVIGNAGLRRQMSVAAMQRGAALPDWDASSRQLSRLLIHGAQLSTIREAA